VWNYLFSRGNAIGTKTGKRAYNATCKQRGTDDDHGQKPGAVMKIATGYMWKNGIGAENS